MRRKPPLVFLAASVVAQALTCSYAGATPAPPDSAIQLKGLSSNDAQHVIAKVLDAQGSLRAGDRVYFELVSGAPAAYDATLVPPRQAFLNMRFEHPDVVERLDSPNSLWHPYLLTYFGKTGDQLMWQVEVVLGLEDQVERVEMLYKPPPPF